MVTYPKNYTMPQKVKLKMCIEKAKIKILRELDALTQLFNKIQQLVNNVRYSKKEAFFYINKILFY